MTWVEYRLLKQVAWHSRLPLITNEKYIFDWRIMNVFLHEAALKKLQILFL